MWDAVLGKDQVLHVIVVDDHGALAAQEFAPIGLPLRRIVGRQRIADTEIDDGAVREGNNRPGHVMGLCLHVRPPLPVVGNLSQA
jgi:hypothetical protein